MRQNPLFCPRAHHQIIIQLSVPKIVHIFYDTTFAGPFSKTSPDMNNSNPGRALYNGLKNRKESIRVARTGYGSLPHTKYMFFRYCFSHQHNPISHFYYTVSPVFQHNNSYRNPQRLRDITFPVTMQRCSQRENLASRIVRTSSKYGHFDEAERSSLSTALASKAKACFISVSYPGGNASRHSLVSDLSRPVLKPTVRHFNPGKAECTGKTFLKLPLCTQGAIFPNLKCPALLSSIR